MKLENQLTHMATLLDNFATFVNEANPAEVHFLSEILYQWQNRPLPTRELLKACQVAASAKGKRPSLLMLMPEPQTTH